jgi:hypothetical protein
MTGIDPQDAIPGCGGITGDELRGFAWWNNLTPTERANWVGRGYDEGFGLSAASAWEAFKRDTETRLTGEKGEVSDD